MVVVLAHELIDVAFTERGQRFAVPFLALAADLLELDRAEAVGERPERAAGLDLGELSVVADQDELRVRALGRLGELREVSGAGHAGLVDDEHRSAAKLDAAVQCPLEPRDRRRVDPRLVAELAGRSRGQRTAEDRDAGAAPRLGRSFEREGLPRAGCGAHDGDAVAATGERDDELALLAAQRRTSSKGCVERVVGRDGDAGSSPVVGALEQEALGAEQRPGRVALLALLGGERDDLVVAEHAIRQPLDRADGRAVAGQLGYGLQDVAARERRLARGEPILAEQALCDLVERLRSPMGRVASQSPAKLEAAEPVLGGSCPPLLPQAIDGHAVLLAPPRLERRDLCCPCRRLAASLHVLEDLGASPREMVDHCAWHAGDVGGPALDGVPAQAQALGELGAQRRLVEVAGRLRVPVQQPPVQRGPAAVRTLRRVRDHDVRVQQRITRARGPVPERRRDEAAASNEHGAAVSAACHARLTFQIRKRVTDRGLVSGDDLAHDLGLADPEQHAHALRRTEGEVEAGDGARGERLSQRLAGRRVLPAQQPDDALLADGTLEPEGGCPAADPCARSLALAGVVVLPSLRDLVGVVATSRGARAQLPDRQHARPSSR